MSVFFGTTEITGMHFGEQEITEIFFGSTEIFTVWGEYDGTLPATYTANGSALADYRVYGSAGGVGDRTAQLFDKASWNDVNATRGTVNILSNGVELIATANDAYTQTFNSSKYNIPVIEGGTYTLSWNIDNPNIYGNVYIFTGSTVGDTVLTNAYASAKRVTFTIPNGHKYVSFRLGVLYTGDTLEYTNIMLVEGSTAPASYVPYGYVVPMSVSDGTTSTITPIYIGSSPLGEDEYVDYGEGKIYRRTAQLFNKNTVVKDCYISLNGEIQNANYNCSDFIPISAGSYYLKNVTGSGIQNSAVVYDANKRALRYANVSGSYTAKGYITLTDGDAYIRVNFYKLTNLDTVDIIAGSIEPTEHIPYVAPVDPPVPLPALSTVDGTNIVDYAGQSAAPSRFYAKYRKG